MMDAMLLGGIVCFIIGLFILIFPNIFFRFYRVFDTDTFHMNNFIMIFSKNPEKALSLFCGTIILLVGFGLILFSF
jgi:hypothetical protein